jgi:hypothetical protein
MLTNRIAKKKVHTKILHKRRKSFARVQLNTVGYEFTIYRPSIRAPPPTIISHHHQSSIIISQSMADQIVPLVCVGEKISSRITHNTRLF